MMTYEEALRLVQRGKYAEADELIVEALEKQTPRKPHKSIDRSWGVMKNANVCPCCDYYLGSYAFIELGDVAGKNMVTYCETCGQAIDWSDEE